MKVLDFWRRWMTMRLRLAMVLGVAVMLLTGCDEEVALYLNPDGSGKIIVTMRAEEGKDPADAAAGKGPAGEARETALKLMGVESLRGIPGGYEACPIIAATQGVEAWTNLRVVPAANGRPAATVLRGYFRDVNQLRVAGLWNERAPESAPKSSLHVATAADGSQVMSPGMLQPGPYLAMVAGMPGLRLEGSPVDQVKQRLELMKSVLAMSPLQTRVRVTVQPAGTILSHGVFTRAANNNAALLITEEGVQAVLALLLSDAGMLESLAGYKDLDEMQLRRLLAALAGAGHAPASVAAPAPGLAQPMRAAAGKASFDYATEVVLAQKSVRPDLRAVVAAAKEVAVRMAERERLSTSVMPGAAALAAPLVKRGMLQQAKQSIGYTVDLNPDGSGRVTVRRELPGPDVLAAEESLLTELRAKGELPVTTGLPGLFAADIVNTTAGVEHWTGYHCEPDGNGVQVVGITGYFRDVNGLKLGAFRPALELRGAQEPSTLRMTPARGGPAGWLLVLEGVDPFGVWRLMDGDADRAKEVLVMTPPALNEALKFPPVLEHLEEAKGLPEGLDRWLTIRTGGAVRSRGALTEQESGAVSLIYDCETWQDAVAAMSASRLMCRALVHGQAFTPEQRAEVTEAMLGETGALEVQVTAGPPRFSYEAVLARERENHDAAVKEILEFQRAKGADPKSALNTLLPR